jgi:hypothetical protein
MSREYAVMSAGHGSGFRFDGPDPDRPTLPLLTRRAALADADRWVGHACTIGGAAIVVHVPSGRRYDHAGRRILSGYGAA